MSYRADSASHPTAFAQINYLTPQQWFPQIPGARWRASFATNTAGVAPRPVLSTSGFPRAGFRTMARSMTQESNTGTKSSAKRAEIPPHPYVPRGRRPQKSFVARVWENVKADRKNLYLIVVSSIAMTAAARIAKTKREAMIAHDDMESQLRSMRAEADAALNLADGCKEANARVVELVKGFEQGLPRSTPTAVREQASQLRVSVQDAVEGKLPDVMPVPSGLPNRNASNSTNKFTGLV